MLAANPFLIGADPEFCFLDGEDIVNGEGLPQGKLGWDHNGRVVELRPDPQHLASKLCADIFRTLNRRELVPYRRYKWKAGAMAGGQPIGGHIHFDIPWRAAPGTITSQSRALDRMAEWFERLELFPSGECGARRREGRYGHPNDIRGSGRRADGYARMEYRTPPSWLYSPDLAHLTLTAFKLAVLDPTQTLETLQTPDISPVTKLRNFVSGFAEADDDASELAPRLASRNGLDKFRVDPNTDIKLAWGLPRQLDRPTEAATSEWF